MNTEIYVKQINATWQLGVVIIYASALLSLLLSRLLILRNLFTLGVVATKQFVNKLNFCVVDIQPSIWTDIEEEEEKDRRCCCCENMILYISINIRDGVMSKVYLR